MEDPTSLIPPDMRDVLWPDPEEEEVEFDVAHEMAALGIDPTDYDPEEESE